MSPPQVSTAVLRGTEEPQPNPPLAHLNALADPSALVAMLGPETADVPMRLWNAALYDPARAFLAEPGKGFRANLVHMGWDLAGGEPDACPPVLAVILEWLHGGSLIVDDIEDGSLTRRGHPALHVSHGLPLALNTGNFLYFAAQMQIDLLPVPAATRAQLHADVVHALVRCHHGQALDLAAHVEALTQGEVAAVVRATTALKTGALTALAAVLGARATGADAATVDAIAEFGAELGNGLQMLDDLGSILSAKRHDKGLEDLRGGRPTWAWAWLAEDVDPFTFARLQTALRHVMAGEPADALLTELHDRLSHVGRVRVGVHLDGAVARLRERLGPTANLANVVAELERLRSSYV